MEKEKIVFTGSHPDSLYRVPNNSGVGASKVARALRLLRWPAALVIVCVALAIFVYFLMPDNTVTDLEITNGTYWETSGAGAVSQQRILDEPVLHTTEKKEPATKIANKHGTKTPEIDFYDPASNENIESTPMTDSNPESDRKQKLPIPPIFPSHISLEVQYGNERAEKDTARTPKVLDAADSTIKPHITQKPEKPLAIYFKDAVTETITRAETMNDFASNEKQTTKKVLVPALPPRRYPIGYKLSKTTSNQNIEEPEFPPEVQEYYARHNANVDVNFTSGHSKFFGIGIEDAENMQSTTQSSLYNTRVSPTLPTWRDKDDSTTKKYPLNVNSDVTQCHSTHLALCRGVLPYDLAGAPTAIGGVDVSNLLPQLEYLAAANCSDRVRHFACSLLEPECSAPHYPTKMPCYNLCKAIEDSCGSFIPQELHQVFRCNQYSRSNCVNARGPCFDREIQCGDGTCVPRDWMCDGTRDCPGGEDEKPCSTCGEDEFRCESSGNCIQKRWVCDGYLDCNQGEDEDESTCKSNVALRSEGSDDLARGEPGEESAGSAPAPSVRRPNRLPESRQRAHRLGDYDVSKELLVTSESNNAVKRNFTRRPSPSRLTPYRPKPRKNQDDDKGDENPPKSVIQPKQTTTTTTVKPETQQMDDEDVNIGDLGFFEDLEKEDNIKGPMQKAKVPLPRATVGAIPSRALDTESEQPRQSTRLEKVDKFEKVIDGAALLRKAAEADAAEAAAAAAEAKKLKDKDDDFPTYTRGGVSSHSSPCPSGELRCVDGRCITLAQLCDGTIDCSDHADEDNCYT